jgi:hypothetical protein
MRIFIKLLALYFAAVIVLSIINPMLKPAQDERMRQVQLREWERQAVEARAAAPRR